MHQTICNARLDLQHLVLGLPESDCIEYVDHRGAAPAMSIFPMSPTRLHMHSPSSDDMPNIQETEESTLLAIWHISRFDWSVVLVTVSLFFLSAIHTA